MPKKYSSLDLGPLPANLVNRALGTELEPGEVHMSGLAHRHAAEDHPGDYPICWPRLAQAIASPTYIGQAPRQGENFELVRRFPGNPGGTVLVAVGLERDEKGRYRVKSFYLIDEDDVERRRHKGYLRPAVK